MTEWISVKERLPSESNDYLIHTNEKCEYVASWSKIWHDRNHWSWNIRCECSNAEGNLFRDDMVTHWMPLPKPPEELDEIPMMAIYAENLRGLEEVMMPDITMCEGKDCPLKEKCYRYRCVPGEWQSYFSEPPYKEGKCRHFTQIKEGDFLNTKIKKPTSAN